jgi:hypothetical protein
LFCNFSDSKNLPARGRKTEKNKEIAPYLKRMRAYKAGQVTEFSKSKEIGSVVKNE